MGLRLLACLVAPKYPVLPWVTPNIHVPERRIGLCTCALDGRIHTHVSSQLVPVITLRDFHGFRSTLDAFYLFRGV